MPVNINRAKLAKVRQHTIANANYYQYDYYNHFSICKKVHSVVLKSMKVPSSVIGTEAWWQSVALQGTPLIANEEGENALVTFLWRDPDGDEFHSAIRNVWLNIIGITDHHHGGLPHSLERVAGTDVWQTTLSLSQSWRGSYSLMPDAAEELPP